MARARNQIYAKGIMMDKKNIKFLSSVLGLISAFSGCGGMSQEEYQRESERLYTVSPDEVEQGLIDQAGENSHIIKASDHYAGHRIQYRKPLLTLDQSSITVRASDVIGLIFDLSRLPKNMKIGKATLGLYRIDTVKTEGSGWNYYDIVLLRGLKIENPELFFNNMVLGNINSAYVPVKYKYGDLGLDIIEDRITDIEKDILDALVFNEYDIVHRPEARKLAESTRKAPLWITGEPLGSFHRPSITYRDLIHYFMEDKTNQAWHEGKWDYFNVTNAVKREYQGDKELLFVLMQYPKVFKKDPLGARERMPFSITWASPDNTSEVAPQIFVEFDTGVTVLRPEQDESKSTDTKSLIKERLRMLKELLDEGIITKEEYESRRQSIIDKLLD